MVKATKNPIAELQIVDCLLPGQVRKIGGAQYLTPRRPARTTASDCSIRGGEYVAYDRADTKTALKVWLPAAEAGDPAAQANVGEIFEAGIGGAPNYEAARIWYERAAKSGNKKAQFNLGVLYEEGLGGERDRLIALNWYRQAWDMPEDELMYRSAVEDALSDQRETLTAQKEKIQASLDQKTRQISALLKQIAALKAMTDEQDDLKSSVKELSLLVADLTTQRNEALKQQKAISTSIRLREPNQNSVKTNRGKKFPSLQTQSAGNFGRYYALIIGNADYDNMEDLVTPLNDANQLGKVLEQRYGFNVIRLFDANQLEIMDAVNNLNETLTENDNLLIYFAGHGNRVKNGTAENGYWLPVDADAPPRDTLWVANETITRHLSRLAAKRILVVADSCYSGILSNAPGQLVLKVNEQRRNRYVHYKKPETDFLI